MQRNCFSRYDDLINYIQTLPLGDNLNIVFCGCEPSLVCNEIENAYKRIKRVEKYIDVNVNFGLYTNGTNIEQVLALVDKGILKCDISNVSWDGIYSASKSRKSKNSLYNDNFFNNKIKLLGQSGYGQDILVRSAVSLNTIDHLSKSLLYLLEQGCKKWEYYFLTDCDDYRTTEFALKFEQQLITISEIYNKHKFDFFNLYLMYHAKNIVPNELKHNVKFIGCGSLGETLNIDYDGSVYPCGFYCPSCSNHDSCCFGDISGEFDVNKMKKFISQYKNQPLCDFKNCDNFQCFECPEVVKYRQGETFEYKSSQICGIRTLETEIFNKHYDIDSYNYQKYSINWDNIGIKG
jgi:sulfatase maturation enzyme AslB (radical SAM superfamily)